MSAIPRKTQLGYGTSLTASGNIAVWGSYAQTGIAAYSNDAFTIQDGGGGSYWANGLNDALVGNKSPTWQDLNGLFFVLSQQIQYLLQSGMPEWDSTAGTPYWKYNFCRVNGTIYQCTPSVGTGPVTSNPTVDTNNWTPYSTLLNQVMPGAFKAWAVFNGTGATGPIVPLNQFNVTSLVKNGTGDYTLTPTTAFANANNGISGAGTGGIATIVSSGTGSIRFQTQGIISGPFVPVDYSYFSVGVIGS